VRWLRSFWLLCAVAWAQPAPSLPEGMWSVSETSGSIVQGHWHYRSGSQLLQARWQNGTQAVLRLDAWDGQRIQISRLDASGPTTGLRAVYSGVRQGSLIQGQVHWYWPGGHRQGKWTVQLPSEA